MKKDNKESLGSSLTVCRYTGKLCNKETVKCREQGKIVSKCLMCK